MPGLVERLDAGQGCGVCLLSARLEGPGWVQECAFGGLMDGFLWEKRKSNYISKTYCVTCVKMLVNQKSGSPKKCMHMGNDDCFFYKICFTLSN